MRGVLVPSEFHKNKYSSHRRAVRVQARAMGSRGLVAFLQDANLSDLIRPLGVSLSRIVSDSLGREEPQEEKSAVAHSGGWLWWCAPTEGRGRSPAAQRPGEETSHQTPEAEPRAERREAERRVERSGAQNVTNGSSTQ